MSSDANSNKSVILIVDDTPENLDVLRGILDADYEVKVAINGNIALKIAQNQQPDLILLDVMMPDIDGFEVCKRLKAEKSTVDIPIIFVTAMLEPKDEEYGLDLGAVDYITKPISPGVVKSRVKTHLSLADQQRACQKQVEEKTQSLQFSQKAAIHMLGEAGHYNDTDTGVHIWRMAAYSGALAHAINWSVSQVELITMAAPMHDTGKIGIPDEILKAPRKLDENEWAIMKTHSQIGYDILQKCHSELFQMAAEIALYHHEKWDGSGYPHGLTGEHIPLSARIVAIADVFDALTMKRPYKDAWPIERAVELIKSESGRHFDPNLVSAFVTIIDEIVAIKEQWEVNEEQELF